MEAKRRAVDALVKKPVGVPAETAADQISVETANSPWQKSKPENHDL
jgi:hypothetical protein